MSTPKQKKRERIADLCTQIAKSTGRRSEGAEQLRAANRRVEKRKGQTR